MRENVAHRQRMKTTITAAEGDNVFTFVRLLSVCLGTILLKGVDRFSRNLVDMRGAAHARIDPDMDTTIQDQFFHFSNMVTEIRRFQKTK